MMRWSEEQERALDAVRSFLAESQGGVFVLKGYAGTGKTTLVKAFLPFVESSGRIVRLVAPTGRAAKVLGDKCGREASTIHRAIYQLDTIEEDETTGELCYYFPLRTLDEPRRVVTIVDESSMVQSRKEVNCRLNFGRNGLLRDLLDNAAVHAGGKIIFIGDPAQLPPVGETMSHALDESFFASLGIGCTTATLTQVMRQDHDSLILRNAMMLRDLLGKARDERNTLVMRSDSRQFGAIDSGALVDEYLSHRASDCLDSAVMLCYSNRGARNLNRFTRERLFPDAEHITAGDVVISVANHYNVSPGVDVLNGEFLRVVAASENTETRTQRVQSSEGGEKCLVPVPVNYRDVTLRNAAGTEFTVKIVDDLLSSPEPNLLPDQMKSMYIDFKVRHGYMKEHSQEFASALKDDRYFNALKIKYGYALTGHKSQGGEWDSVLVDFDGRTGLDNDCLRWMYTAVTRARTMVLAAHMPTVTVLSRLRMQGPIERVSKARAGCRSFALVPDTPYHGSAAPLFLKAKYWAVADKLEGSGFSIAGVESKQYREIYHISSEGRSYRIDGVYGKSGVITRYECKDSGEEVERLLALVRDESRMLFSVNYTPSTEALLTLYNNMASACSEADAVITNIVENTAQYNVAYFLKTTADYACIDFYFDGTGAMTYMKCQSLLGEDDEKLKQIIEHFK